MDATQMENSYSDADDVTKVFWLCGKTFAELYIEVTRIWCFHPETQTYNIRSREPLMRGPHIEVNFTKGIVYICI